MRNTLLLLLSTLFLLTSCGKNEPTREEAKKLIREYYKYPATDDINISCGDEDVARRLMKTNLEKDGWINIRKTIRMIDTTPFITFTEKSEPYLLPTEPEDSKYHRQNVKTMDIDIGEITGMETSKDGNHIMVKYRIKRTNKTPFVEAMRGKFDEEKENRAYLARTDAGWQVDKKAEVHFLNP